MLLQVHDELLFEVPEADAGQLACVAARVMESAATLSVPLVVETGAGRTWQVHGRQQAWVLTDGQRRSHPEGATLTTA